MELDFTTLDAPSRYKLLTALVIPRPIALVTSRNPDGTINAAPYSFFNAFSHDPPLVVLGIEHREPGIPKDTGANIDREGEFVVNFVDEALAEAMNICAVDFPAGMSELAPAGLHTAPSNRITTPRLREAPAALECRLFTLLRIGRTRQLVIGEVVAAWVRDDILDPTSLRLDLARYRPVGRLFGHLYCRIRDVFPLRRMDYREWQQSRRERPSPDRPESN